MRPQALPPSSWSAKSAPLRWKAVGRIGFSTPLEPISIRPPVRKVCRSSQRRRMQPSFAPVKPGDQLVPRTVSSALGRGVSRRLSRRGSALMTACRNAAATRPEDRLERSGDLWLNTRCLQLTGFLPAPDAGLRLACPAHDLCRADAVRAQQDDGRPPHMLLGGIAVPDHAFKTEAILGADRDGYSSAHAPDSHTHPTTGIRKRTLPLGRYN